eukprot:GHVS01006871.1.p1 GENE.GHVS01006871.1~~GHVS01006871.1.p1  ORF type:complete len:1183 (-),score=193.29 GHVS01006871.1:586-4134(-)
MVVLGRLNEEEPLQRILVDSVREELVPNRTDQPRIDHNRLVADGSRVHELLQRRSSRSASRSASRSRRVVQRSASRKAVRPMVGANAPSPLVIDTYLRQWQRWRRRARSRRKSRERSGGSDWEEDEGEARRTFDGLCLLKDLSKLLRGGGRQHRGRTGAEWAVPEPAPLVEVSDRLFVSKLSPDVVHRTLCPPASAAAPSTTVATVDPPNVHPSTGAGNSTVCRDRSISDDVLSPSSSTNKLAAVHDFTRYPYAPHNPLISPPPTRRYNLFVPTDGIRGVPRRPPILFHSVDDVLKRGELLFLPPAARSFPSVRKFIAKMDSSAQAQLQGQMTPLTHYRLQRTNVLELLETGHTHSGPALPPPPVYEYPHEEVPVNHLVLIWRQPCSYRVEVAGTFTTPPWTHRLTLYWCPRQQFHWIDVNEAIGLPDDDRPRTDDSCRHGETLACSSPHSNTGGLSLSAVTSPRAACSSTGNMNEGYSTFSRRTLSPSHPSEQLTGPYQFKFIVDGEWKCDPTLAICEDFEKNVNNIVVVCAQLRRRASQRRLRQRQQENYQREQQPCLDSSPGDSQPTAGHGSRGESVVDTTPKKEAESAVSLGREMRSYTDGSLSTNSYEVDGLVRSNSLRQPSPATAHRRSVVFKSEEARRRRGWHPTQEVHNISVDWKPSDDVSPSLGNEGGSPSSTSSNLNRCQSAYSNCRERPPALQVLRRMSSMCTDYWPLDVVENLHNADVLLDLKELPDVRQITDLEMQCAAVMIPHPDKVDSGGADAYFLASDGRAVGVADGVGEWDTFGLNPRMFAEEVMQGCKQMADSIGESRRYADSVRKRRAYRLAVTAAGEVWPERQEPGDDWSDEKHKDGFSTSSEVGSDQEESPTCTTVLCDSAASYEPSPSISPAHKRAHPTLYPGPPLQRPPKSFHRRYVADSRIEDRAKRLLSEGFRNARSFGSCTGLVACLDEDGSHLGVANLGDSALIVLRRQKVFTMSCVYRTREQQHQFNCPFQLSRLPEPSQFADLLAQGKERLVRVLQNNAMMPQDTPEMAACVSIGVKEGDLILVGTDGLFDNLFDYEICQLANLALSPYDSIVLHDKTLVTSAYSVARALGEAASYRSRDPRARTPFMRHARQSGANYLGGKLDDITVVACWVVRKSHKEDCEQEAGEQEAGERRPEDPVGCEGLRRGASMCL